jgi:hypothetical protein
MLNLEIAMFLFRIKGTHLGDIVKMRSMMSLPAVSMGSKLSRVFSQRQVLLFSNETCWFRDNELQGDFCTISFAFEWFGPHDQ